MPRKPPSELKHDRATDRAYVRYLGVKKYFGKWGSQQSFADFATWLKDLLSVPQKSPPQDEITVEQCVARYLVFAEAYYSQDGKPTQEFVNVRAAMRNLLGALDPGLRAVDYGPKRLKDLQRAMAAEVETPTLSKKAKKKGASPKPPKLKYARSTINSRIDRIRRCFRWCASEELIPVALVTALETVAGIPHGRQMARESVPVTSVSFQVVADTLPYLSPTVATMVQVQALCGMRPQDVCGMTTGAIDMKGDIWLYRPEKHKGAYRGKSLVKGIPAPAQAFLRPLLRQNPAEPIFSSLDSKQYFGNAPKRSERKFYSSASYGKSIVGGIAAANKAGESVPHWAPNQLRHAVATELRRTAGIEAAQVYLGHSKPDTTLIYAEQTVAALVEVARGFVSPLVVQRSSKRE